MVSARSRASRNASRKAAAVALREFGAAASDGGDLVGDRRPPNQDYVNRLICKRRSRGSILAAQ